MSNEKSVVWKAKTEKGEVEITNDGFHYRAKTKKGKVVGQPFVGLQDLLDNIKATLIGPDVGGADIHADGDQKEAPPAGGADLHVDLGDADPAGGDQDQGQGDQGAAGQGDQGAIGQGDQGPGDLPPER